MSKIEWTKSTWNPIVGCSHASPGCTNCYAQRMAGRLSEMSRAAREAGERGFVDHYDETAVSSKAGPVWTGKLARAPLKAWREPLDRHKPTTFFVCSMSDVFHERMPEDWIGDVFVVMAQAPQHTFQVLTKRSSRMRHLLSGSELREHVQASLRIIDNPDAPVFRWPLPNVHLGVSCEDQRRADERIPDLLATPAAIRFISAEPLLGPIRLDPFLDCTGMPDCVGCEAGTRLSWVIVGGESGPGARPCNVGWIRQIVGRCARADVPVFVKQMGATPIEMSEWGPAWPAGTRFTQAPESSAVRVRLRDRKGGDVTEWPVDLRIRQAPVVSSQ